MVWAVKCSTPFKVRMLLAKTYLTPVLFHECENWKLLVIISQDISSIEEYVIPCMCSHTKFAICVLKIFWSLSVWYLCINRLTCMEQYISADRLEDWYWFNENIKLPFLNVSSLFIALDFGTNYRREFK